MMFNKEWDVILKDEVRKEYFLKLESFIREEYKTKTIYPAAQNVFNAFHYTDYDDVKVLILGQDPYHEPGQAHGLAFSVQGNTRRPPSLDNIFKELDSDLGIKRENNNLTDWTKQGVMLLNTVLTVENGKAFSHANHGWEIFTDTVISKLNERKEPVIFVLWGSPARSKKALITNPQHHIIESPHPSPLSASRGFFGSKPFSKINSYLDKPIKWA